MTMGGKTRGGFEGRGDGFAFLDAFMHVGDGLGDDDVAGSFLDDGQGLQNGHAAADQGAQGAGETGNGDFADDRAEHRDDFSLNLSKTRRPSLVRMKTLKDDDKRKNAEHGAANVVLDGLADAEDKRGEARATLCRCRGCLAKISLNLGMTTTMRTPMMAVATTMTAQG